MNYRRWGGVGWSEDFSFLGGGVGHMVFQGEWRGDLSSPAEYKENSIENRQPVREDHKNTSDPLGDKVNFYCNTVIILTQTPQTLPLPSFPSPPPTMNKDGSLMQR